MKKMNGIKFNYYLGALSLIGLNISTNIEFNALISVILGLLGLALYVLEGWAFHLKINRIAARYYFDLSGGNVDKFVQIQEPGCMIWYAFMVRMLLRIGLALFSVVGLSLSSPNDLPLWGGIMLGALILFELFFMLYIMFESRIFRSEKSNLVEDGEKNWRTKYFTKLSLKKEVMKESYSDVILLISAWAINITFWNAINSDFIDFINRSYADGESALLIILLVVISSLTLCLFMLIPVRLAHWVEESINARDLQSRRKLRWSIVFAGLGTISPSLIELVRVYLM